MCLYGMTDVSCIKPDQADDACFCLSQHSSHVLELHLQILPGRILTSLSSKWVVNKLGKSVDDQHKFPHCMPCGLSARA